MLFFSIFMNTACICCTVVFFVSVLFLGKNCELCNSGFFRLEDSNPASIDVCRQCNCHTAGTVNGSETCAQVHTTQSTYARFSRHALSVLDLSPFRHFLCP